MSSLDLNSFSHLGTFTVAHDTRLVSGACNPEKDLVLLIHRTESRETLSLWKLQGSKRWEVDVASNFTQNGALRHIAWSPDGDKFAIGHALKRVTVHSVLDGCEEYHYEDHTSSEGTKLTWKMASVTWLRMPWKHFWNQDISKAPPPQLYPRDYDSPGSALYLFKQLPRLDYKAPLVEIAAGTDISVGRAPRSFQPSQLEGWPSLPSNHLAAAIATSVPDASDQPLVNDPNERWNVVQSNTCLFAGDNHGALYPFIHGTYRAGVMETKPTVSHLMSIVADISSAYFSRLSFQPQGPTVSILRLTGRIFAHQDSKTLVNSDYRIRDILRISTAAKDLALYAWRNCDQARIGWMGGGGREGAREWNAKWIRVLQSRNQGKPIDVKADLTSLLLTGLPLSTVLPEHLEHGNQTTERNFKKWHAAIGETLLATKHASELAILSLQRLISLLWDLYGLAQIKLVSKDFLLDQNAIKECIEVATRTIGIFVSMADVARREERGFHHFMVWLRGLIPNMPPTDPPLKPYDTLLVNGYISHGFAPSGLDAFFPSSSTEGSPLPADAEMKPQDSFEEVASVALMALKCLQTKKSAGKRSSPRNEVDVVAQINSLLTKCTALFSEVANSITALTERDSDGQSVSRRVESGIHVQKETSWMEVILPHGVNHSAQKEGYLQVPRLQEVLLRERLVVTETGVSHYIMLRLPEQHGRGQQVCLIRAVHQQNPPRTSEISSVILDLRFIRGNDRAEDEEDEDTVAARLLDAQFYDDTQLVLVLQTLEEKSRRSISLLDFAELTYHEVLINGPSIDINADIIQNYTNGKLMPEPISLTRSRVISSIKGGDSVSLAVNSKRKVAVLLDHDLSTVYSYDLSADDDVEAEESHEVDQETSLDEDSMAM